VEQVYLQRIATPLGEMVAAASTKGVLLLEFGDRNELPAELHDLQSRYPNEFIHAGNPILDLLNRELAAYFAGQRKVFSVPLVVEGTSFQKRVWQALLKLGYGTTLSYGALAQRVAGDTKSSRAVASANAQNQLAILVPCHRVIGADGSLTGYAGGMARKRKLLALEGGQGSLF